jgi:hypothetical protein
MDNNPQNLTELFPSLYHRYHLCETAGGFSFQTLSFYYYLLPFLILTISIYYLVLWESSKWKQDFEIYFSPFTLAITAILSGIISFASMYLIYGHDIRRVDFDLKERKIKVYGLFSSETIPFDNIKNLTVSLESVKSYKGSGSSLIHHLKADDTEIMNFNYGKFNNREDTSSEAFQSYAQKLVLRLKSLILPEPSTDKMSGNNSDDEERDENNKKSDLKDQNNLEEIDDYRGTKTYTSGTRVFEGKLVSFGFIDTDCDCHTKFIIIQDKKGKEHEFRNYSFDLPDDLFVKDEEGIRVVFNSDKYFKRKVKVHYRRMKCKCSDGRGNWDGDGKDIVKMEFK